MFIQSKPLGNKKISKLEIGMNLINLILIKNQVTEECTWYNSIHVNSKPDKIKYMLSKDTFADIKSISKIAKTFINTQFGFLLTSGKETVELNS